MKPTSMEWVKVSAKLKLGFNHTGKGLCRNATDLNQTGKGFRKKKPTSITRTRPSTKTRPQSQSHGWRPLQNRNHFLETIKPMVNHAFSCDFLGKNKKVKMWKYDLDLEKTRMVVRGYENTFAKRIKVEVNHALSKIFSVKSKSVLLL